jgi:hypothetical protein
MDTSDFLKNCLMRVENSVDELVAADKDLIASIHGLDKKISIIETKMRQQTAIIALAGTLGLEFAFKFLEGFFNR